MTENYQNDYIVNICLSGEKIKLKKILNENIFLLDDFFLLFKIFSKKIHRLINIKKICHTGKNIETALLQIKPPIFWKEKDEVKKQISLWNEGRLGIVVKKMNEIMNRWFLIFPITFVLSLLPLFSWGQEKSLNIQLESHPDFSMVVPDRDPARLTLHVVDQNGRPAQILIAAQTFSRIIQF